MTGAARWSSGNARRGLLAVNAVGLAAAAVFAALGVRRPGYGQPGSVTTPLTGFWAASSAVCTWAVTAPLLVGVLRGARPAPQLLVVAGLVQLADAALGARQHNPHITALPAAMGPIHPASARLLSWGPPGDRRVYWGCVRPSV